MGVIANIRRVLADTFGKPSFAGTPFPDGGVDKTDQLTQELGGTGTFNFGGFIRGEDFNPQMDAQTAIKNLDEMRRSDAQAHAALEVVKMPIRQADYEVDPADPDDPESMMQADFVRWCLFEGMTTSWDDLIRQALLMLDFGFMLFEKVWMIQEDGQFKDHIILKRLAPRPPKTLWQWFTDEDGALLSIKQLAVKAGTYQFLDIPADKLVRFTFQQEGDNFQGISMLRTAYPHWLIKKQLYVIDAIRATRFGVGIPRAKLLAGYKPTIEDRAAIALMLQGLSSHQHAYLIQPPQVDVDILMPQGVQGGAQLLPSINHQNEQITRNILAQFLDMGGKSSGGSRALGASAMDFFLNAIESIANQICDVLNKQVIKDLIDMNFETGGKYPRLRPVGIHETDVKSMAAAAASLAGAGFLTPDKKTENTFRVMLNLPEVPDEDDALLAGTPGQIPGLAAGMPAPGTHVPPASGAGTPAKPATAAPKKATPATAAPAAAKPATAAHASATPATAQPTAAETSETNPRAATPATAKPVQAVLRPGIQAPPMEYVEPAGSAVPDPHMQADGGTSGRPADANPAVGQPAQSHEPAHTTVYQTMPANTTWATAQPAVSSVREPAQATTTVTKNVPATAHMARNSTQSASSGTADEEGHTSNEKATPATSQPHAATPATARATTAIPASEIPPHTHPIALASRTRLKSDRPPDRWTMEDGQTTLWRQPTLLETQILDLAETPRRLDSARTALRATLQNVREEQILRIAALVAHASKTTDLKAPLVGKMTSDIQKSMKATYAYGFNKVKDELRKQKTTARRFADSYFLTGLKIDDLLQVASAEEQQERITAALALVNEQLGKLNQSPGVVQRVQSLYEQIDRIKHQFELLKRIYTTADHDKAIVEIRDLLKSVAKDVDTVARDVESADTVALKRTAVQQLVASAEVSAQSQADRLLANARGEALRLQRAGWTDDEVEDALKINMGQLSDADISKIASQETNEAFSLGRAAAAADFKDRIEKAVYSAILDNNCCPVCEDLDGEEFDVDSPEYEENMPPNTHCEGGDACRCTYIYVLDPDTSDTGDTELREIVALGDFEEEKHPRGHGGKFTTGSGPKEVEAGAMARTEPSDEETPVDLSKGDVTLYHGTTEEAWTSIQKEGLIPHKGTGGDAWAKKNDPELVGLMMAGDRKMSVYMSQNRQESEKFANLAAQVTGGHPLMLQVHLPASAQSKLRRDEQDFQAQRFVGKIPPSWITKDPDPVKVMTPMQHIFADGREITLYAVVMCSGGARQMYDGQPRAEHGKFGSGKLPTTATGSTAGERGMPGMMSTIAKPDGGFTYHAVTGHQPTTGYALSVFKGRERVLDAKTMTPADLVKFARDNHDILTQKDNYFGAWHNPVDGKVYLDVSKVVGSAHEAERVGRANHQLAYFDLAGGKSVDIAGQQHREQRH